MSLNSEVIEKKKGNIIGKLLTGIIIGIAVFSLFFLWGDFQSVKDVIGSIPLSYIIVAILFTLSSYLLRFAKWHYFLYRLKIKVGFKDSLNIFFIGMSMSITPGKIGELLKSYLLKNISGTEVSRSAPAVFVDRLTDLFAMLVLVSFGVAIFSFSYLSLVIVFLVLLSIVLLLQSRKLSMKLIDMLTSLKVLKKHKSSLIALYESANDLLKFRTLTVTTIISVVAWFMECVSLFVLVKALGLSLGIMESTFIFSFGTVAGALSMLPGGLGVAEGSITGLLMYFSIDKSVAVSLTLLIRLVTLWLGVVIGLGIFFKKRKDYMI
jgi:glycosyltransferase 2 family protein